MASQEQSPGRVHKSPLASGISAETERLLGCLLTPKDTISNTAKPSVEWKSRVHTATGASSKTASEHSGASNVSTPETPLSHQVSTLSRPHGIADLGKLPSLLRNLDVKSLMGSTSLVPVRDITEITSPPQFGAAPVRVRPQRSFETAKAQVDADLHSFRCEVANQLLAEAGQPGLADDGILSSVLHIANKCMEEDVPVFKYSIQDIVDELEEMRKTCKLSIHKSHVSRLLFILTRCSRLVLSEEPSPASNNTAMYGTQPRNRTHQKQRRFSGFPFTSQRPYGGVHKKLGSPRSPIARATTLPTRSLRDMMSALDLDGHVVHKPALSTLAESPSQISSEATSSGSDTGSITQGLNVAPRANSLKRSPLGRSVVTALEAELDQVASPSLASETSQEALSEPSTPRFATPAKGRKGILAGLKQLQRRLRTNRCIAHQDSTSTSNEISSASFTDEERTDNGSQSPASPIATGPLALTPVHTRPHPEEGSGSVHPPSARLQTVKSVSRRGPPAKSATFPNANHSVVKAAESAVQHSKPHHVSDEHPSPGISFWQGQPGPGAGLESVEESMQPGTPTSGCTSEAMWEQQGNSSWSLRLSHCKPLRISRQDSGSDASTSRATADMSTPCSPKASPKIMVVCRICEEQVPGDMLERHSKICCLLDEANDQVMSVDARLTQLANAMEERLEEANVAGPLASPHNWQDMESLVVWCRAAAALQPDGTDVPSTRCEAVEAQMSSLEPSDDGFVGFMDAETATFASRIRRLMRSKVEELQTSSPGLDSGSATPATSTSGNNISSMTIDDFEILKPISRGAFGRVYLCKKRATGDLLAIKVMRKNDLIRKNMVESVRNERNILAMANNPFVVRFYYSFTSRDNLYIVMEYLNGGDCFSLLRVLSALDEDTARLYIAETVLALEYCHTQAIIHRDLKPDNLLISSQGHVKLTDFGLSCIGVIDRTDNMSAQPMDMDSGSSTPSSMVPSAGASPRRWSSFGTKAARISEDGGRLLRRASEAAGIAEVGLHFRASETSGDSSPDEGQRAAEGLEARAKSMDTAVTRQMLRLKASPMRVSADNLPLGRGSPRLKVSKEEKRRAVGTPDYLAPELLLGTGHGAEVDWWSLGAILYEFVTGVPPFNADSPEEIFSRILDRQLTWPEDEDISSECKDLVDRLLQLDPCDRFGHRGAGEIKLHPWFKGLDWTTLARTKAAFIPCVESETDTSYFFDKPVSAMSMARDVTDSSPAQPQSSSSRLANEAAASCGSGPGRGPSRRNSRRALTERALAEGAARTRSKGVRARESRMSLASNSGTASPPVMSPESSQSELHQDAESQYSSMEYDSAMAVNSLRNSVDEAIQLSIDGREPTSTSEGPNLSRRSSMRISSDGGLPGINSHHSSMRNSSDGGLPPLRSWRGSLHNSCDGGLPIAASRRDSFHNSVDGSCQPSNGADAGTLMHRLSNLSSAVKLEIFDMEDADDQLSQSGSASSGSDGLQDTCARDLASDDLAGDHPVISPTNQFSDFSFKNYGLLAEHNMEALRAEFAEAHAEKANVSSSTDEHVFV